MRLTFSITFLFLTINLVFAEDIDSVKNDKDWSIFGFPLAFYQPETSLQLGVGGVYSFYHKTKDKKKKSESFIAPYFLYSIKKQMRTEIFGQLFFKEDQYFIDFELNYYKYFYYYYGIGSNTKSSDEETYDSKKPQFWINAQYRIWQRERKKLYTGIRYIVEHNSITSINTEGLLATSNITGIDGGFSQGFGVIALFDSRDNVYFPWKGSYLKTTFTGYPKFTGNDYAFNLLQMDHRSFFNVKNRVVFALNAKADFSFGNVPFYSLPSFGSRYFLRGYLEGRYRDSHSFSSQLELRIPAWKRLIFTGFIAAGNVSDNFTDLTKFWDFKPAIGFGGRLRLFKDKGVSVRADMAFWKDAFGLYVVFNEAF